MRPILQPAAGSRPAAPGDRHHPPGQRPAAGGVACRTDLHGRICWTGGSSSSKPPSTSSGGIRTITSSIAAGTATGGAAKAMWARRSMRSSRWPTSRPWRRANSMIRPRPSATPVCARRHRGRRCLGRRLCAHRLRRPRAVGRARRSAGRRHDLARHALRLRAAQPLPGQVQRAAERDAADELGLALLRHCYTEFTYLSRFLPSIYYGEHGNGEKPRCPGRRQAWVCYAASFLPSPSSSHARQPRRPAGRHRARVLLPVLRPAGRQHPFLPLWFAERGLDSAFIGLIVATALLPKILSTPVVAHVADQTGRAHALIAAALIGCCAAPAIRWPPRRPGCSPSRCC